MLVLYFAFEYLSRQRVIDLACSEGAAKAARSSLQGQPPYHIKLHGVACLVLHSYHWRRLAWLHAQQAALVTSGCMCTPQHGAYTMSMYMTPHPLKFESFVSCIANCHAMDSLCPLMQDWLQLGTKLLVAKLMMTAQVQCTVQHSLPPHERQVCRQLDLDQFTGHSSLSAKAEFLWHVS